MYRYVALHAWPLGLPESRGRTAQRTLARICLDAQNSRSTEILIAGTARKSGAMQKMTGLSCRLSMATVHCSCLSGWRRMHGRRLSRSMWSGKSHDAHQYTMSYGSVCTIDWRRSVEQISEAMRVLPITTFTATRGGVSTAPILYRWRHPPPILSWWFHH